MAGVAAAGQYSNTANVTGTNALSPTQQVTSTNPSHYFGPDPSIELIKYTNGDDADTITGPYIAQGGTVTWTYYVRNTGNLTLTIGVGELVDDVEGAINTSAFTLLPGESTWLTKTGVALVGQYTNTAVVTGTPNLPPGVPSVPELPGFPPINPTPPSPTDTNPSHYFGTDPKIELKKYTNGYDADAVTGPNVEAGKTVTWTYVVTNTGNVPLTNFTLVDDVLGAVSASNCAPNPLPTFAVGAVTVCTISGIATAGQYTNTGIVTGTNIHNLNEQVSSNDPSHYFGADPRIVLKKYTNGQDANTPTGPIIDVGQPVTWTYVITNIGNVDLTDFTLTDDKLGLIDPTNCAPNPLPTFAAGASTTCTVASVATEGQYRNDAVVSGTHTITPSGVPELPSFPPAPTPTLVVTSTDPSHYFGGNPGIDLIKYTNGYDADVPSGPMLEAGSAVTWTYVIRNTGNVTLTNVTLTDDKLGVIGSTDCPALGSDLLVGGIITCTMTGVANVTGQYENTAVVTGTDALVPTRQLTSTDPSHYFVAAPDIEMKKYVNGYDADTPDGVYVQTGDVVTWTYVVTNTGNVTLTNFTLVDDQIGNVVASSNCSPNPEPMFVPGAVTMCTMTGIAIEGAYKNTGVVSGTWTTTDPGTPDLPGFPTVLTTTQVLTDSDPAHYYGFDPEIVIKKYTNGEDADTVTGPNIGVSNTVTWTYEVTNTGNVTLSNFVLNDDVIGLIDVANCAPTPTPEFVPGASTICTLTGIAIAGQYTNVAVVSGTQVTPVNPPPDLPSFPTTQLTDKVVTSTDPSHYIGLYASLGNLVWEDLDHDGRQDIGEPGIEGVVVTLETPTGTITTTTSITGYYRFDELIPGDVYTVTFEKPSGYESTFNIGGVNDPTNSDANETTGQALPVVLSPGEHNPNIDAGYWRPASLGDYVWHDIDRDGIQEVGEPPIAGVLVTLQTPTGTITTTTSVTGYYRFDGLLSGVPYTVTFGKPSGYELTIVVGGVNIGDNSDADPTTGRTDGVMLSPGEHNPNIDAGYWLPASLGNFTWIDVDRDGVQDVGEPPMAGVLVTLQTPTGTITTTTSVSGYYRFDGLIPTVPYELTFTPPPSYTFTVNSGGVNDATNSDANPTTGKTAPIVLSPGEHNPNVDSGFWKAPPLEVVKINPPGTVRPQQHITYTIVIRNIGNTMAKNVVLTDAVPSGTTFVSASGDPTVPIVTGNPTVWQVGDVASGKAFTATFIVRVNDVPSGTVIINQAVVGDTFREIVLNSNEVQNPLKETAVTLDLFTAKLANIEGQTAVLVKWRTSLEKNTLGFNVWRSASGKRADAVKISSELIAAKGASGGTYEYVDAAGFAGAGYWLEEIELNGASNWYGAAMVAGVELSTNGVGAGFSSGGVRVVVANINGVVTVDELGSQSQEVVGGSAVPLPLTQGAQSQIDSVKPLVEVAQPQAANAAEPQAQAERAKPASEPAQSEVLKSQPSADELAQVADVERGRSETSASQVSKPSATHATRDTNIPNIALMAAAGAGVLGLACAGLGVLAIRRRRRKA
jgi:uncharacterized repeat protein (TIGR01451 family)